MTNQSTMGLTEDMRMLDYWGGVYRPADQHIDSIRAAYDAFLQHYTLPRTDDMLVEDHELELGSHSVALRVFYPALDSSQDAEFTHAPDAAMQPGSWVFYVHGGGQVVGSLDSHEFIARQLAAELNVKVFLLDYGLAPEFGWQQALLDCQAAFAQICAQAETWNIQANQAMIAADGSGCSIALQLQQSCSAQTVQAMALYYPIFSNAAIEAAVPATVQALDSSALVYRVEDQPSMQDSYAIAALAGQGEVPVLTQAVPACFVSTAEFDRCPDATAQLLAQLKQSAEQLQHVEGQGLRSSALPLFRDCPAAAQIHDAAIAFLNQYTFKAI